MWSPASSGYALADLNMYSDRQDIHIVERNGWEHLSLWPFRNSNLNKKNEEKN